MMKQHTLYHRVRLGALVLFAMGLACCAAHDPGITSAADAVRSLSQGQAEAMYQRFGPRMKQTMSKEAWLSMAQGIRETVGVCRDLVQAKREGVPTKAGLERITLHMVCARRPGLQVFQLLVTEDGQLESFFYQGVLTQATNHTASLLAFLDLVTRGDLDQAQGYLADPTALEEGKPLGEAAKQWTATTGRCNGKGRGHSRPAPGDDAASLYTLDAVCFQGDHQFELLVTPEGKILTVRYVKQTRAPADTMQDPLAPTSQDSE